VYREFYGFERDPFSLSPDPHFFYLTHQHREALSGLVYATCTHPGLTLLVGEVGSGKTMLLYTLRALLQKRNFSLAFCVNPTYSPAEFFDFLLHSLGVQCTSPLKSRQLIALEEKLLANRQEGKRTVLIVDEAQRLSMEVLEEVRLLLNLETPQEKLLEIIMAGQQELSDFLQKPELRQLKQRISFCCKLNPLTREELTEYVQHRLMRSGLSNSTLFPRETLDLVYSRTKGIPRLVNTLCDNSLRIGFAIQSPQITLAIVNEAAADLSLPAGTSEVASGLPAAIEAEVLPAPKPHDAVPKSAHAANGSGISGRVPMESYAARQKSFGLFGSLMDRWK
jgi:type II secretory pathway predicted ATPase ExeA